MKAEAFGLYKKKGDLTPLLPDFVANSVLEIDFDQLKKLGVEHILIDLDLTLRKIGSRKIEDEILQALKNLNQKKHFRSISLVTNNWWAKRYADAMGLDVYMPFWEKLHPVRKPNTKFFTRVLDAVNAKPSNAAMIGDKVHADIIGANNVGMLTILVKPRGRDYWFDRLLFTRRRERHSINHARSSIKRKDKN